MTIRAGYLQIKRPEVEDGDVRVENRESTNRSRRGLESMC